MFALCSSLVGVISTNTSLDRETIPSFTIIIMAKDLGNPSRNSTTTLTVALVDANDNPPKFDPASLLGNVTEERPKGEFVTKLVATDPDSGRNSEIEYKLESNAQQFLKIDSQTGIVETNYRFDFEVQRNYSFKVIASDKGRLMVVKASSEYLYRTVSSVLNWPKLFLDYPLLIPCCHKKTSKEICDVW